MVVQAILHLGRELESKLPPRLHLVGNEKAIWRTSPWLLQSAALVLPCAFLPTRAVSVTEARVGWKCPVTLLPRQGALFTGWKSLSAPFYLPRTWPSPSALNMFCGIACTASFSVFLPHEISMSELLNPFSLIRKAQRNLWKMEEWEVEARERVFFNCTYAEMSIAAVRDDGERRKAGG